MLKRNAFLRDLRQSAKELGLPFELDTKKGKGSHYRVKVGGRTTTVPSSVTPALAKVIRKQLGLE